MKKMKAAVALVLAAVAVLLALVFLFTLNIGNLSENNGDADTGVSLFFGILFVYIPAFSGLAVAAALFAVGICLFALKGQRGVAIALLIVLGIYLPFLAVLEFFGGALIAPYSAPFLIVLVLTGIAYLALCALAVCYLLMCGKKPQTSQFPQNTQFPQGTQFQPNTQFPQGTQFPPNTPQPQPQGGEPQNTMQSQPQDGGGGERK